MRLVCLRLHGLVVGLSKSSHERCIYVCMFMWHVVLRRYRVSMPSSLGYLCQAAQAWGLSHL